MLRNECGGDATTTYGGTTKITTLSSTTSASMTQSSSSSTSAQHLQQWTGGVEAGGDMDKKTGAGNDMQRNHMLDAIAVGVVLFCFLTFVPQRQTFPLHIIIPVIWPHWGKCGALLVGTIYVCTYDNNKAPNMLKFPELGLLWQGKTRQVLWFLWLLSVHQIHAHPSVNGGMPAVCVSGVSQRWSGCGCCCILPSFTENLQKGALEGQLNPKRWTRGGPLDPTFAVPSRVHSLGQ